MDIHLPGMNGMEAAKHLQSWPETAATPIVALTAAAMLRDTDMIAQSGFARTLTKPVRVDELIAVLQALLPP
jgi:CheY-like chemotaxis protein